MNNRTGVWLALSGFGVTFMLFALSTPPSSYELHIPRPFWYAMRLAMQVAWLAPLMPIWKWNANAIFSRNNFLYGFLVGGGWVILATIARLVFYYHEAAGEVLPLSRTLPTVVSSFFLALTSGLYASRARRLSHALLAGFVCLLGQLISFVIVFNQYIFIEV